MKFWIKFLLGLSLLLALGACHNAQVSYGSPDGVRARLSNLLRTGDIPGPNDEEIWESNLTLTEECQKFLNNLPAASLHGFLEVPEDYNLPEGRKILVFYYGAIKDGETPILFYNGGPGGSSWSSYYGISDKQEKDAKWGRQSFIFMDQRGTGCSTLYPEGSSTEDILRLTHYYSPQIVADSEVLRKKLLGDRPWKIFGQSYGGLIVHRYILDAPDGVVSAFSHGSTLNSDPYKRFFERIKAQNSVLGEYLKVYPEDLARLQDMKELLSPRVCLKDSRSRFCGKQLMVGLNFLLGFNRWDSMHQWVIALSDDLRASPYDLSQSKVWSRYFLYLMTIYSEKSYGPSIINRMEMIYDGDCPRVMRDLKQMGEHPETWLLHECMFSAPEIQSENSEKDEEWAGIEQVLKTVPPNPLRLEDLKLKLKEHPQISFYLYSGSKDTFVPTINFLEAVHALGGFIHYRNFSSSGHDGFLSENQIIEDLSR